MQKISALVQFENPVYLEKMAGELPENVTRATVLALLEKRDTKLNTNRIYMIDVVFESGETYTFLQGYCGGGNFAENNFMRTRLINDYSDSYSAEDEDIDYDGPMFNAFEKIKNEIDDGGCTRDEDEDVLRYSDLSGFKPYGKKGELQILYRAWLNDKFDPQVAENDLERLKKMIEKSGILFSI